MQCLRGRLGHQPKMSSITQYFKLICLFPSTCPPLPFFPPSCCRWQKTKLYYYRHQRPLLAQWPSLSALQSAGVKLRGAMYQVSCDQQYRCLPLRPLRTAMMMAMMMMMMQRKYCFFLSVIILSLYFFSPDFPLSVVSGPQSEFPIACQFSHPNFGTLTDSTDMDSLHPFCSEYNAKL